MRSTRFVSLAVLIVLSMLLIPGGVAAQGNSEAAKACEDGGYLNYTDADGNGFKNAGQCTRYAAQGGTLVPARTVRVEFNLYDEDFPHLCAVSVEVTGFAVGTYDTVNIFQVGTFDPVYFGPTTLSISDPAGTGSYQIPALFPQEGTDTFEAVVDGVSSGPQDIVC